MIYNKPPLSFPQQADQLLKRGLIADRDDLIHKLQQVSYYRLSGYWFPFRKFPDDHFKKDTHFKTIWNRYVFDRQLRLLVLDGIERIEISLRTNITYILGHETVPLDIQKTVISPIYNRINMLFFGRNTKRVFKK